MYQDKVVLITGASRGVGAMLTRYFLDNQAVVLGLSKKVSDFKHPRYKHFAVDIGDPEAITSCFRKEIRKSAPKIDIVINNAALITSQYSMILPIKNAIEMVNVNLLGVFFVSREAAILMRNNECGRIVNIGSMASSLKPAGDSVYAACKQGIITLAGVMSKEFSSMNITCNTLAITAIETDMLKSHSEDALIKINEIIRKLPIPRMANISDIKNVIDFFVSDKSSYITGQTIYLGGIN